MQNSKQEAYEQNVGTMTDALEQLKMTTATNETEKIVVALRAIAGFCAGADLKHQNKAIKIGCHEQIIQTLAKFPTHAQMAEEGLRSINNMACNHMENKAILARAGAIRCVISSLKANPTYRGVVEWGVGTLNPT